MSAKNMKLARTISQVLCFLLLVIVLVGAFCSVGLAPGSYLTCSLGMLQLTISSQQLLWGTIASGVVLLVFTLLLGRFFCGWVCPFGALLDWLQKPLSRIRIARSKLPAFFSDGDNKAIKYGVLGGTLLAAGITRGPSFCAVCPVGTICRTAGLQGVNMGAEAAVIPLIASLETVNKRFWCKVLCPIGALLALASRFSSFKLRLPWAACSGCKRCEKACPMDNSPRFAGAYTLKMEPSVLSALIESGLPDALDRPARPDRMPAELRAVVDEKVKKVTVNSTECTRCYSCAAACPVISMQQGEQLVLHQNGKSAAV